MAEKQIFDKSKPHVNIGLIGHVDHGKSTTVIAITSVLSKEGKAKKRTYEEHDKTQGSWSAGHKQRGKTITATHVEIWTDERHYSLIDCPGHKDYIRNMITGAAQMDGAVLVIASETGPQVQTEEHLRLARDIGVKKVIVFINDKSSKGMDEDDKELAKVGAQEQLKKYGYDENSPILFASSKRAAEGDPEEEKKILELVKTIDKYIPTPKREVEGNFLMYIEKAYKITGQGTIVTGKIEKGKLKKGDKLELVGFGKRIETAAKSIESFQKSANEVEAGDDVGICLQGVEFEDVKRGQVLATKGTVKTHKKFVTHAYILGADERGRKTPFTNGYRPQFFFMTADSTGTVYGLPKVKDKEGKEKDMEVEPGTNVEFSVELNDDVIIMENSKFIMQEGGVNVGEGTVTKIIE